MFTEKIAYLYASSAGKDGKKIPIVQYEMQKIPVKIKEITLKVSMVGLAQNQKYQMSANIFSPTGENVTNSNSWVEFEASDSKETAEGIAVSLEAKFDDVEIQILGNYSISAILKKGDEELDCATCYFNVRKS